MRRLLVATASLTVALLGCKGEPKRVDHAGSATASAGEDPWAGKEGAGTPAGVIARPFLWKAEKDGGTTWLFGTVHLGVNAETQLPPWVMTRLDGARTFAMEADTSDQGALAQALVRSDGGSLRADLGPDYWKKLEDEIGAKLAAGFDGMKPFAVMTVLLTRDLPMTPPMDGVLAQRARDAGKPIHYFEQAVDQIAMIDPWMAPADVKAMLDNRELARKLSVDLIAAYRAGDDAALGAMFDDQTLWLAAGRKPETFPAYLDSILGKRNRAWVPQIEELHAGGGAFVAVGAGHLVGPGNVLDLLRARGFTITRVTGP